MAAPKSKEEIEKRRSAVKDFMETIGPFSVPVKVLAEEHNVTVKTIYNDIQFWLKKIDVKNMDVQGKKLIMSLMKNMAIVEELKAKGSPSERIKAIQTANQTAEVLTKIMENYGFKEKIADKMDVRSEMPVTFNIIEKSVEEIKREKLNRNQSDGVSKAD